MFLVLATQDNLAQEQRQKACVLLTSVSNYYDFVIDRPAICLNVSVQPETGLM